MEIASTSLNTTGTIEESNRGPQSSWKVRHNVCLCGFFLESRNNILWTSLENKPGAKTTRAQRRDNNLYYGVVDNKRRSVGYDELQCEAIRAIDERIVTEHWITSRLLYTSPRTQHKRTWHWLGQADSTNSSMIQPINIYHYECFDPCKNLVGARACGDC